MKERHERDERETHERDARYGKDAWGLGFRLSAFSSLSLPLGFRRRKI